MLWNRPARQKEAPNRAAACCNKHSHCWRSRHPNRQPRASELHTARLTEVLCRFSGLASPPRALARVQRRNRRPADRFKPRCETRGAAESKSFLCRLVERALGQGAPCLGRSPHSARTRLPLLRVAAAQASPPPTAVTGGPKAETERARQARVRGKLPTTKRPWTHHRRRHRPRGEPTRLNSEETEAVRFPSHQGSRRRLLAPRPPNGKNFDPAAGRHNRSLASHTRRPTFAQSAGRRLDRRAP